MSAMRSRSSEIGVKEYVLCFIVILAICFGFQACHTSIEQGNWHEEIVAICGKEVVTVGSGDSLSHQYRIYTSGQTYVVKDYYGSNGTRFNSADAYGRIEVGRVYKIESFGYRVPALSRFWNIETIELTQQEPTGTCQLMPSNN